MSRIQRFFCYFLLFLIPLFVLTTKWDVSPVILIYFPAKYFLWGIGISLSLLFFLFQREKIVWHSSYFFLLCFWIWMFISFSWSINRHISFENFIQWSLIIVSLFIISQVFKEKSHIKKAFWIVLVSQALVILISFLQQFGDLFLVNYVGGFKYAATMGNPIFISCVIAIISPFFIFLFKETSSFKKKVFLVILSLLNLSYLFILSKGVRVIPLICLIDSYVLFLFFIRQKVYFRKIFWSTGISFLILVMCAGMWSYKNIDPSKASSTIQQRWIMWRNTVESIRESPWIGTGIGTFSIVYSKYEDPQDRKLYSSQNGWSFFTRFAHNEFLHLIQELGFMGFFLFFLFVWALFRNFKTNDALGFSLCFGFLNFLILSLVHFPFHEPAGALLFSLMSGLLISQSDKNAEKKYFPKIVLFQRPFLSGSAFIVVMVLIFGSFRFFLSEWYWQKAKINAKSEEEINRDLKKSLFWNANDWEKCWTIGIYFLRQDNFIRAKEFFIKASVLNPYMPHLLYNLGISYFNLGKEDQALYVLDRALELGPDYLISHHIKGLIYYKRGDFQKALDCFKNAIGFSNNNRGESHYMAALCYVRQGKYWLAKKEAIEAIGHDAANIRYHIFLRFLDHRIPFGWTPSKKSYSLTLLSKKLRLQKYPKILIEALKQAQAAHEAHILFSQVLPLLSHENIHVQMEAMHYFCSLSPKFLVPLFRIYKTNEDAHLQWRLFYIISETMPQKDVLEEAKRIYRLEEGAEDTLFLLTVRYLSKISPYDLLLPSSQVEKGSTLYLIRFYAMN